jgi:hypothetical protein
MQLLRQENCFYAVKIPSSGCRQYLRLFLHRCPIDVATVICRAAIIGRSGWAGAHVGEGEDQIAQVVLQRGRALHQQKLSEGVVKNPRHFAMDASQQSKRRQIGAPILPHLRIRPIISGDFGGARRRAEFEGHRGFLERKAVRKEL